MAPGTNIGAAHPVSMGGEKMDKVMTAKVENDAAAFVISLATRHGRNAKWAEQAVRKSVSASADEAYKKHVVDLLADSLPDLLAKVDGRKVTTAFGEKLLHTKNARTADYEINFRLRFLRVISDPNVAYILMMIGILGIFFELSNPGLILPGVVGGISLVLAFYAFQTLPVNYAGVLLILLAILFFIAEIKITSYGLLSVAGVVSFLLGSIMLIESDFPYMRISMKLILPTVLAMTAFFLLLVRIAVKSQGARPSMDSDSLVGQTAEARTAIDAMGGDVFTQGAHWGAYSDEPVAAGEKVVVEKVDGLRLKVRRTRGREDVSERT